MEQYVYLGCFLFGLLFTIVSVFFGHHFGGGSDAHFDLGTGGHAEAGYEHSGMPGISPFSPTTICAFITAFGGFGLIFSRISATKSVWVSTPLSLFGGLLISAAVLALFSYAIWASRYTKVGPNQVLVVSGRKHKYVEPDGTCGCAASASSRAAAPSSCRS
jgi:hypothetical protein